MKIDRIPRWVLLAVLLVWSGAQAQALKDAQWAAWLDAGRTEELERAAKARLARSPDDVQANVALALAATDSLNKPRLEAAQKLMQACIRRQPDQAACYYALGAVQGVQALGGGALKAIALAGSIRSNLSRAVELDPLLFEARQALLQFYLLVPGIAGGSDGKANQLVSGAEGQQPEHAKVLRALVAGDDKRWDQMERELRSVRPGDDRTLRAALREAWGQLGFGTLGDKQPDKAREVFEALQRDWPGNALGYYGMGRLQAQQGQLGEAVRLFERARSLDGADRLPIDHRLGLALMEKGDKAGARVALQRFVNSKKANPRNVEDARKHLAELG